MTAREGQNAANPPAWGDKPNPGSKEAIALGCRCPVLDNNHGAGLDYPDGPAFWVNSNCPLHSNPACSSPDENSKPTCEEE